MVFTYTSLFIYTQVTQREIQLHISINPTLISWVKRLLLWPSNKHCSLACVWHSCFHSLIPVSVIQLIILSKTAMSKQNILHTEHHRIWDGDTMSRMYYYRNQNLIMFTIFWSDCNRKVMFHKGVSKVVNLVSEKST